MSVSIWDEASIGGLELANRAVMSPMGTGYCSLEGDPLQVELDQAMRKIGELAMENELCFRRKVDKLFRH